MLTHRNGWIGVDVGARSVKLAQLARRGGTLRLAAAQVVQRLQPWRISDTSAVAARESADEITAGVSLCGSFRGRTAASLIPRAACTLQSLGDAPVDNEERRAAIVAELASQYAGPPDSIVFDCWTSDFEEPAAQNVLVVSSTEQWARRIAADHGAAGLTCKVLDGAPLALARAVELAAPGGSAAPQAVLDWGYSQAVFCIVWRQRPLFVRQLRGCGLQLLIDALCERLAVTCDEAHELLADHGAPAADPAGPAMEPGQLVWSVVQEQLGDLVAELDRTLTYLETHRRRLVPSLLLLFGGGAMLPNIENYLRDAVDIETRCWSFGAVEAADEAAAAAPLLGPAIALSSLAWARE